MKRLLAIVLVVGAVLATAPAARAVIRGQFQIRCFSSHVAQVDPIVSPGTASAHNHEFFGNRTVNKDSTYASMIAGATNCSTNDATAGYWTPTLLRPDGSRVEAKSLLVYYRGSQNGVNIKPFPANLKIVSDDFRLTNNSDGFIIKFPDCWDGKNLDSVNHRSHMAFGGSSCPASHPVRVPAITEIFRYDMLITGMHLSSGSFATGHADYWQTWDQAGLEGLVTRCLNGAQNCGRIDS